MEEEPVSVAPDVTDAEKNTTEEATDRAEAVKKTGTVVAESGESTAEEFDLSDISSTPQELSRDDIIAAAEAEAFGDA